MPDHPEYPVDSRAPADAKSLRVAIAASLVLHLGLAVVLLNSRTFTFSTAVSEQVRINLVPINPQRQTRVIEPPAETLPVEAEAVEPQAMPRNEPDSAAATESVQEFARNPEEVSPAPPVLPEPVVTVPQLELPDRDNIQQSLQQIEQARVSRLYRFDCDARQERSDLIDCGEQTDDHDYQALEVNPTYRSLNPIRQISRSQRTVSTVAANLDDLSGRLEASGIDAPLRDYLMQEIEIGISEHANQRQSSVEMIYRMTDQSAAAQQAREIFDPWVRMRSRELQQRRVELNP